MNQNTPVSAFINRDLQPLIRTAMGKQAGDLAVVNARLVNVYSGEVLDCQSVVVSGKWIVYVGQNTEGMIDADTHVIDAKGKTLIPGFIEGHTHLAWFYNIPEFIKYAAPGGTTTVIAETMEPYPVCGVGGVIDFLDSIADQPIKFFATAPVNFSISTASKGVRAKDLKQLLLREDILGLGESYWQEVLQSPEQILPAIKATLAAGKTLEGHSAGAKDGKLAAYTCLGISSCHEPITAEEALERLRLGLYVMIREGSIRKDLKAISEINCRGVNLRRLILATDGVEPKELMEKGYLDHVVRKAVQYDFDPVSAIQMASLNVAEHFSIDHMVGGIAPGKYADMLLIPDLKTIQPDLVISNGRIIAENNRLIVRPRSHEYRSESLHSIHLDRVMVAGDFVVAAPSGMEKADVAAIQMVTDLVTREKIFSLPVKDGQIPIRTDLNLIKVAAVDRTHVPGKTFTGLLNGFGLKSGAMACSAAWDTADIIVVGADEADMATCVNRIHELNGGVVICKQGKILAEVPFPVFGVISDLPMKTLADSIAFVNQTAQDLGAAFPYPLLSLNTLTTSAIPYLRICEQGLVDLKTGQARALFTDKKRHAPS